MDNVTNEVTLLIKIIAEPIKEMIAQIRRVCTQMESSYAEERENCEEICKRAENDLTSLMRSLFNEKKILIDNAVNAQKDETKLNNIKKTWSIFMKDINQRCDRIASSLFQVIEILKKRDKKLRKMWRGFVSATALSGLISLTMIGLLAAHCHPLCVVQLPTELFIGVIFLLGISLSASVCGTSVCFELKKLWNKMSHSIQLMLEKHFPGIFKPSAKKITETDISSAVKKYVDGLEITDDIWQNVEALEMIKRRAEEELQKLEKKE